MYNNTKIKNSAKIILIIFIKKEEDRCSLSCNNISFDPSISILVWFCNSSQSPFSSMQSYTFGNTLSAYVATGKSKQMNIIATTIFFICITLLCEVFLNNFNHSISLKRFYDNIFCPGLNSINYHRLLPHCGTHNNCSARIYFFNFL